MFQKIINVYKNMKQGVKVSLWFAFCNFFQKGISMLSVPIFTRLMTTQQYGKYSVYQSWYSILTIIVTLNLFAGVYNKGMIKYEEKRDSFTSAMQGLSTLSAVFFFLVYLINIDFWTGIFELEPVYMISMFLEMMFAPAYYFWSARQRFEYKYVGLVIVTVIISLTSPVVGILAVLSSQDKAAARVLAYAGVQIVAGIIFYCYNEMKGRRLYHKEYWKYALAFNLPLIPHYLSQIILNQADRIMISRITSERDAAIYSVAYNISLIMSLLTNAINATFVPSLYTCLKNKKYRNIRKNTNYVILFAAGATFLAMLFGPELIKIFAPPEYYEAVWIIPPVAISVYFIAVYAVFVNIEFYFEKTNYVMFVSIIGALANIGLNYVFIHKCGYLAAGYTTVVCYIMFAVGHYLLFCFINKRYLKHKEIIDGRFIFFVSVFLCLVMFFVLFIYRYLFARYGIILLMILMMIIKRNQLMGILKNLKEGN